MLPRSNFSVNTLPTASRSFYYFQSLLQAVAAGWSVGKEGTCGMRRRDSQSVAWQRQQSAKVGRKRLKARHGAAVPGSGRREADIYVYGT